MELMDVSLHGLLTTCHNSGKNIPEDLLGYTAVSILEALKVCKSKGIIHRDVKPENILMKKSGEIKLADFGESRFVGESQKVTTIGAGTIRYWPPERLHTERTKYDIRSDIWSFGITLAEMAYGKYPIVHADFSDIDFQTVGFITLQNRILEANADEIINRCVRSKYSEDLCEFIWLCLQKLEDRVDVEELIETELYESYCFRNKKTYTIGSRVNFNISHYNENNSRVNFNNSQYNETNSRANFNNSHYNENNSRVNFNNSQYNETNNKVNFNISHYNETNSRVNFNNSQYNGTNSRVNFNNSH
uniref:mitogen-activated protein kinase kinase n=1 Tax=Acrobeloides nanus TaxID=290746 RepID=A0A914CQS0_9BILA